jgi:hypothetical protein
MSLRDQLLKAGLTNKKKVRQANRSLKKQRKSDQGARESAAERRKRERAERAAAKAARAEKVRAERARELAARELAEKRRLVRRLLRSWALPDREGQQLFFHKAAAGPGVVRCMFPESWVYDLRRGRLAVAWAGVHPLEPEYVVVRHEAAQRVAELQPERLLFWNAEGAPPEDDLSEQPYDMGAIAESRERVQDRWSWMRAL